jgi:hypothetical protein
MVGSFGARRAIQSEIELRAARLAGGIGGRR